MDKVVHKELSYKLTGLLFRTHKNLGCYRNEKQYGDYFESLLKQFNIKYVREYRFKDENGNVDRCIIDFLIDDEIILEFKAKNCLNNNDYYQTRRYLATLSLELGILVNFRQPNIVPKRVLNIITPNNTIL